MTLLLDSSIVIELFRKKDKESSLFMYSLTKITNCVYHQ